MCGVTFCAPVYENGVLVKYYATNGDVVKTEKITNGAELTGITGYDGKYRFCSDENKAKYLTIYVPKNPDEAQEIFVEVKIGGPRVRLGLIDKDRRIYSDYGINSKVEEIYDISLGQYEVWFNLNNIFGMNVDGFEITLSTGFVATISRPYEWMVGFVDTDKNPDLQIQLTLYDMNQYAGQTVNITQLKNKNNETVYCNKSFDSFDEFRSTATTCNLAEEVNVYTDYVAEPVIAPGTPDSEQPGTNTPAGQASVVKANVEALKTQWNALKMGDFKAAKGWQLISTASAVAVASIALVVSLWIGAVKISKMSRKAKYRKRRYK